MQKRQPDIENIFKKKYNNRRQRKKNKDQVEDKEEKESMNYFSIFTNIDSQEKVIEAKKLLEIVCQEIKSKAIFKLPIRKK